MNDGGHIVASMAAADKQQCVTSVGEFDYHLEQWKETRNFHDFFMSSLNVYVNPLDTRY